MEPRSVFELRTLCSKIRSKRLRKTDTGLSARQQSNTASFFSRCGSIGVDLENSDGGSTMRYRCSLESSTGLDAPSVIATQATFSPPPRKVRSTLRRLVVHNEKLDLM